eukprot:COSAG06_NODE_35186_length_463_cov_0.848901_1_plen_126_part_01
MALAPRKPLQDISNAPEHVDWAAASEFRARLVPAPPAACGSSGPVRRRVQDVRDIYPTQYPDAFISFTVMCGKPRAPTTHSHATPFLICRPFGNHTLGVRSMLNFSDGVFRSFFFGAAGGAVAILT